MRIAYYAEATPNGFYRSRWPMTALARRYGHQVRALALESERWSAADVRDVDVLFVHRVSEEEAQLLAREARRRGASVVWDNDDDMTAVPKSVASHTRLRGMAGGRRLADQRRMLGLVDLVTSPSRHLAQMSHQGAGSDS